MRNRWTDPSRAAKTKQSRSRSKFRPTAEGLEPRVVMTRFNLGEIFGNLGANDPAASPQAFGIQFSGQRPLGGLGSTVTMIGDVDGDGLQDFAVTEPIVGATGSPPDVVGGQSRVYIVFGSRNTSAATNWLTSTPRQRAGGLNAPDDVIPSVIGGANFTEVGQNNFVNGQPGFDFDGVVFQSPSVPNSQLGFTVTRLGDIDGDRIDDFMITDPNAPALDGSGPAGRAYIVFGSANLRNVDTFDIDLPVADGSTLTPEQRRIRVTTVLYRARDLNSPVRGEALGYAAAGLGNVFGTARNDIIIGDPLADVLSGTLAIDVGAAYLIDGESVPTARNNAPTDRRLFIEDILTTPNENALGAIALFGTSSFENFGASLGFAGDTDRTQPLHNEILIGAPGFNNGTAIDTGRAYLVYGAQDLFNIRRPFGAGQFGASLSRIDPNATPAADVIPGAIFESQTSFEELGFAVHSAGLFNNDNAAEILIGAPGATAGSGRVSMIHGRLAGSTQGRVLGRYTISGTNIIAAPGASVAPEMTTFVGEALSQAGYSLSMSSPTTATGTRNSILIGAPGFDFGAGRAYVIPGVNDIGQVYNLSAVPAEDAATGRVAYDRIAAPGENAAIFAGASVSGHFDLANPATRPTNTVDRDRRGDFVIGAPGFRLVSTTVPSYTAPVRAGGAFLIQSGLPSSATPPPPPPPPPPPGGPGGAAGSFRRFRIVDLATPEYGERFVPEQTRLNRLQYRPVPRAVVNVNYLPTMDYQNRANPNANRFGKVVANPVLPRNVFTRGENIRRIPAAANPNAIPNLI